MRGTVHSYSHCRRTMPLRDYFEHRQCNHQCGGPCNHGQEGSQMVSHLGAAFCSFCRTRPITLAYRVGRDTRYRSDRGTDCDIQWGPESHGGSRDGCTRAPYRWRHLPCLLVLPLALFGRQALWPACRTLLLHERRLVLCSRVDASRDDRVVCTQGKSHHGFRGSGRVDRILHHSRLQGKRRTK